MILTVTTTKWTRTNSPVLGSRKVDLPNEPEDEGHEGDGGKCQECTRRRATCPNSTVSLLLHGDVTIFSSPYQLCEPLPALSVHTARACPVRKQRGQTMVPSVKCKSTFK